MRYIDAILKAKLLLAQQTYYQNAEPHMEVIVSRAKTPIVDKAFWEEVIVTEDVTSIRTSVTVHKPTRASADRAYVAYVDDSDILTVKSALFTYPITNMVWAIEETIEDCIDCALEFDGTFVMADRGRVEFRTEEMPWLFYVTASGELRGGILGEYSDMIVAANVTAIDAVRGVRSLYGDNDQGLIIFYIVSGDIYYKQYIDGVWSDQEQVTIWTGTAVSIRAERTLDYRIVLQVKDDAGALHEIFTKMQAAGWNSIEMVQVTSLSVLSETIHVGYESYQGDPENVDALLEVLSSTLYALPPEMAEAYNIDDGLGDYGYFVKVIWDENISLEGTTANAFSMKGSGAFVWVCIGFSLSGKELTLEFNNFNNIGATADLTYTPGEIIGDIELVESHDIVVTLTNLVPYPVDPPELVSIENIEEYEDT